MWVGVAKKKGKPQNKGNNTKVWRIPMQVLYKQLELNADNRRWSQMTLYLIRLEKAITYIITALFVIKQSILFWGEKKGLVIVPNLHNCCA